MEQIFRNGIFYTVEFIKLLLVAQYILKMRPRKYIVHAYVGSLMLVLIVTYWTDLQDISIVFSILSVFILWISLDGEKKWLRLPLSFVIINVIDGIIGAVILAVNPTMVDKVEIKPLIMVFMNNISMIFLVLYLFLRKLRKRSELEISEKVLPIYMVGGVLIGIYISMFEFILAQERNMVNLQRILLASMTAMTVLVVLIGIVLNRKQVENERLKIQSEMNLMAMKIQSKYFIQLTQKEERTRAFRHDIKAHLASLRYLYEKKEYEELGKYLENLDTVGKELSPGIQTGNELVNAIVSELIEQFPSVRVKWDGKLPTLNISEMDICTIFYNMMKNAFEAAVQSEEQTIEVSTYAQKGNVMIEEKNHYYHTIQEKSGIYKTTKEEEGHGYGIRNIKDCVEKNNGSIETHAENGIFRMEIILLV